MVRNIYFNSLRVEGSISNGFPLLAGAVQSGKAFTDAVDKIVKSGNKDEIAVLQGAGAIDKNNKPVEAAAAN